MIKDIYNDNIIIYTFAVLCGLGILVRFILDMVYIYLVKESDKLGTTSNKLLKHMRMKFETCYKLNIGVNNVDTFVDKSLTKYRFCGILLSTWENFSGQVLLLSFLIVPICAIFGVVFEISPDQILFTGAVGVLTGAALILVDKMINLPVKKHMVRLNLLDYLENFCKVRLEHELTQPERIALYRKEYLQVVEKRADKIKSEPEKKVEINHKKEAKKRREEEKRLEALNREMEKKRLEEVRIEEEKRKLEEKKQMAAKRHEEEQIKLQEEREAILLRREELLKKAEEKKLHKAKQKSKHKDKKEIDKIEEIWEVEEIKEIKEVDEQKTIQNLEESLLSSNKAEEKEILESLKEIVAEKEILESLKEIAAEKEETINSTLATKKNPEQITLPELSAEEEKLVEDVLREFFA